MVRRAPRRFAWGTGRAGEAGRRAEGRAGGLRRAATPPVRRCRRRPRGLLAGEHPRTRSAHPADESPRDRRRPARERRGGAGSRSRAPGARELAAGTGVRFTDDRIPSAVLHHVARGGPGPSDRLGLARRTCRSGDQVMQTMAGQVVGSLCGVDFTYTFHTLIEPNALTPRRGEAQPTQEDGAEPGEDDDDDGRRELGRRYFAAVALDQAAREPGLEHVVTRLLKRWRRGPDVALRWTAAAASASTWDSGRSRRASRSCDPRDPPRARRRRRTRRRRVRPALRRRSQHRAPLLAARGAFRRPHARALDRPRPVQPPSARHPGRPDGPPVPGRGPHR